MKNIILTLAIIIFFITTSSLAQGIYLGAGIGNTFYSSEIEDALNQVQEISENSTAWKVFAGYRLHQFIGIEGGYRNFGDISSTIDDASYESNTAGWDIAALGLYQISMIDLFVKAGLMFSSTEQTVGSQSADDSSTDFLWGLGV